MILALVADSHGRLPGALFQHLADCQRILHLGDMGPLPLLTELEAAAPTFAVRGNTDAVGSPELPEERHLSIEGCELHLRHQPWSERELDPSRQALYAHGHTHVPRLVERGQALLLCPGSLRLPRQGQPSSLARLEITPKLIQISILTLADGRILTQNAWSRT